jgi:hypothetical protein
MKLKQLFLNNAGFFFFFFSIFISVEIYGNKTYSGTAVPLIKDKIPAGSDADYWGYLKFVARWGEIIQPQIIDMNGKVIEKGTVLTQMDRKYWIAKVNVAKGELLAAEKSMNAAYSNFKRYKKLYPTGASPVKEYENMRAIYYEAIGTYEKAKADLIENERVLEECKHLAPFEGIVDKVYYSSGTLSTNPNVIEISQLNPIGIKVKMSVNEAAKINSNTPITIYLSGSETPIGVYNGYSTLHDDGIIFRTKNTPRRNNDKNLLELRDCSPAMKFYIGKYADDALGVPVNALLKDDEGYYVWKAKNRKTMQAGKGLDPVFQIEKVYVVPGNLKREYHGTGIMRLLNDPGTLRRHDIVISSPPGNLKNGMTVSFPPERYLLMPGDPVKVVIGEHSGERN